MIYSPLNTTILFHPSIKKKMIPHLNFFKVVFRGIQKQFCLISQVLVIPLVQHLQPVTLFLCCLFVAPSFTKLNRCLQLQYFIQAIFLNPSLWKYILISTTNLLCFQNPYYYFILLHQLRRLLLH